jgi:Uma2 family endonuclease
MMAAVNSLPALARQKTGSGYPAAGKRLTYLGEAVAIKLGSQKPTLKTFIPGKEVAHEEKASFAPICPNFVVELKSSSDTLSSLKAKMEEY